MFEKSEMLKCLDDQKGFNISEKENAPKELNSGLIRILFDILIKYGTVGGTGYRKIFYVDPIFNMQYYFGDKDSFQKNPSFSIDIHNPELFNFSTHYNFFLDNGTYVSWNGNGASIKDVWDIVREIDSSVAQLSLKDGSLVSGLRYPLIIYQDENKHGSEWDLIKRYHKLYTKLTDVDIRICEFNNFGEKSKFFSIISKDPEGFEAVDRQKAPKEFAPKILRDAWEVVCRLGLFHTDSNNERNSISLSFKHFRLDAYCGSISWACNLRIRSMERKISDSLNKCTDFELKNGLKISWDDCFTPLDVRSFLNGIKKYMFLINQDSQGKVYRVLPVSWGSNTPILLDQDFQKQKEILNFSKKCRSFAQ